MNRGACWLQPMGSQRAGHDLETNSAATASTGLLEGGVSLFLRPRRSICWELCWGKACLSTESCKDFLCFFDQEDPFAGSCVGARPASQLRAVRTPTSVQG